MIQPPPQPPRAAHRAWLVALAAVMLVSAGFAVYLMWPSPAADERAVIDSVLPGKGDLPGFAPYDGIAGPLPKPAGHRSGRVVLTGDALTTQCATYRTEGDGWACRDLRGLGWVVLRKQTGGEYYMVLATVLAYPGDAAAEQAYTGLVADIRHDAPDAEAIPGTLADQCTSWGLTGQTVIAYREGPMVVQGILWDGFGVPDEELDAMAVKWPRVVLGKIDAALGRG